MVSPKRLISDLGVRLTALVWDGGTMVSGARAGVAIVGLDHLIQWADPAFCKLLQYECHELIGRSFEEVTHPDDVLLDHHLADRLIAGSLTSYEFNKRYISRSGAIVPAHLTATMIRDRVGRPLYGLASIEPALQMPALNTHRTSFGTSVADAARIRKTILM